MPGMTDRDHFAAAALTGLLASREWPIDSDEAAHYCYRVADAMLRERCRAGADCPVPDNATNLDAAPEAIAPEPEPSAARRRPAGGTGDTDHGAAPAARASVGRPRTDNADLPICAGTGDTPVAEPATTAEPVAWGVANGSRVLATSISRMDAVDMQGDYAYHTEIVPLYRSPPVTEPMPKEKRAEVSDRSKPINGPDPDSRVWETPVHTPATHATPGEGSEQRECTEPVAWAVRYRHGDTGIVDLCRTLADCRAKWRHRTTDYWLYEPLYRHPPCQDLSRKTLTLTDAEREAVAWAEDCADSQREWKIAATLRGLLERMK